MRRGNLKILAGLASIFAWAGLLFLGNTLKNKFLHDPAYFSETARIFVLYFNLPIACAWLTLGLVFGLAFLFASVIFLVYIFPPDIYIFSLISLGITAVVSYRLRRVFENNIKNTDVKREKIEEELNLISDDIKSEEKDNARIRASLKRTTYLKRITEDYSLTLSEEEVFDSIVTNSFELFKNANRILLYLVDTQRQELKLVRSRKRDIAFPVRAKKGDIFDRWALKHRMPLIVDDINKDFRFSLKAELDKGFNSIISAPLTSEHKILGILRVDSAKTEAFNQSDLRFLDIIADLSSVSLENSILYQKVQDMAIHDSLTGLAVHKYFMERLENEVKNSLRDNTDISLLMLDLDDFKHYNDKHGHSAGDLILRHISSILTSFAKAGDIVCRYGGEEFAILFLNTGKQEAVKVAEEIRRKIEDTPLVLRRMKINITASIGVASCPAEEKMSEELLRKVDSRLYEAKEKGKNRVCSS